MFLSAPFAQAVSGLLLLLSLTLSALTGDTQALLWAAACLIAGWLGGMALAAFLCLAGGYGLRGMSGTILVFPVFMASWLPLQVLSLFKDTTRWQAVAHRGQIKGEASPLSLS